MANDTAEKPPALEEGVWTTGPDGELVPDYDAAFPEINEGEVVQIRLYSSPRGFLRRRVDLRHPRNYSDRYLASNGAGPRW